MALGGDVRQLTFGPRSDAMPRWSPIDDRLAFASEAPVVGRMSLFLRRAGGGAAQIGDMAGSVQQVAWARDGRSLIVVAVDEGGFGAATDGAVRLRWSETAPDPDVFRPDQGRRRLLRIDAESGRTEEVGPLGVSVWEFDLVDASTAVALVSDDPSERAWYRARLALLDLENRTLRDLWIPDRQVQGPAVDPSGRTVAVIEGWSSDRGLVAGDIGLFDLDSGVRLTFDTDLSDVTSVGWLDPETLWFAGWQEMGSRFGVFGVDGAVRWTSEEESIVGPNSFHARIDPIPSGGGFVAIRESMRRPPELVRRGDGADGSWRTWRGSTPTCRGNSTDIQVFASSNGRAPTGCRSVDCSWFRPGTPPSPRS